MVLKVALLASLVAFASAGVLAPAPLATPFVRAHHFAPGPILRAAPIAAPYAPYAAAPILRAAPIAASIAKAVIAEEYDPNPQYSYAYDIQDALTGDSKSHAETRNGDVVQGSYSLVEPDGTRRIVEYTADPVHGFNAVVHKEPLVRAVAAAPIAAAPITKFAAPLIHKKIFY